MGIEPFLIASTLNGVLAQRLVRRLCTACRKPYIAAPQLCESLGLDHGTQLYHAGGCSRCGGTGYDGRVAVMEFLVLTEEIVRLVLTRAEARDLQRAATSQSMRTMREDALDKARAGITTAEEVVRVTQED
jgi:general secretion pathway protein E